MLGDSLAETGLFDPGHLRHLFEQHQSGVRDYSAPLWTLLMFDAFLANISEGAVLPRHEKAVV